MISRSQLTFFNAAQRIRLLTSDVPVSVSITSSFLSLRDWSLITESRGEGVQNGNGGGKINSTATIRGVEKVLAMQKGGHNKFCG